MSRDIVRDVRVSRIARTPRSRGARLDRGEKMGIAVLTEDGRFLCRIILGVQAGSLFDQIALCLVAFYLAALFLVLVLVFAFSAFSLVTLDFATLSFAALFFLVFLRFFRSFAFILLLVLLIAVLLVGLTLFILSVVALFLAAFFYSRRRFLNSSNKRVLHICVFIAMTNTNTDPRSTAYSSLSQSLTLRSLNRDFTNTLFDYYTILPPRASLCYY